MTSGSNRSGPRKKWTRCQKCLYMKKSVLIRIKWSDDHHLSFHDLTTLALEGGRSFWRFSCHGWLLLSVENYLDSLVFKEGGETTRKWQHRAPRIFGGAPIWPFSAWLNQRQAVPLYIHTVMLRLFVSVIDI